jgi:hypothetical protein
MEYYHSSNIHPEPRDDRTSKRDGRGIADDIPPPIMNPGSGAGSVARYDVADPFTACWGVDSFRFSRSELADRPQELVA